MSLPRSFNSVYRLFLRTSSAAVLHQRRAHRNLKMRWRPIFDAGAKVTKELQQSPSDGSDAWRQERVVWLKIWNERIDRTLDFLLNAARTRGLPHQVTRNLGHIMGLERELVVQNMIKLPKWQPQSSSSPKPKGFKDSKKMTAKQQQDLLAENSAGALDQVVRMAEATAGMTLGRNQVIIRRWRSRR